VPITLGFAIGHYGAVQREGQGLPPGWDRIALDLERTTGRRLVLADRDLDEGIIDIFLDGRLLGGVDCFWDPSNPDEGVADLADRLQEHSLDEEIWGGWPICPGHHHPLATAVHEGQAVWVCPTAGTVVAPIGQLGI
jgi:hypothetical protein